MLVYYAVQTIFTVFLLHVYSIMFSTLINFANITIAHQKLLIGVF